MQWPGVQLQDPAVLYRPAVPASDRHGLLLRLQAVGHRHGEMLPRIRHSIPRKVSRQSVETHQIVELRSTCVFSKATYYILDVAYESTCVKRIWMYYMCGDHSILVHDDVFIYQFAYTYTVLYITVAMIAFI